MTSKRPGRRWLPAFASLAVHAVTFVLFDAFYRIPHLDKRPTDKEPATAVAPIQRVTFLRVTPGGSPAPEGAQPDPANPMARSLSSAFSDREISGRSGEFRGDESSPHMLRRVTRPSLATIPSRGLGVAPMRTRQIILDSALKHWTAEAERTRQVENPGQFGGWIATIDGQKYGLEPGWLRAGKISVPLPPVVFIPEPYGYERQREASWQREDMRRQIRQRLVDSSVTAAATVLRSSRERERDRAPR